MDHPGTIEPRAKWYRRLQAQVWLWAILPLTLALVAVTFTGVYSHQSAMRAFVSQRDTALARVYGEHIADAVSHDFIGPDGQGLAAIMVDAHIGPRGVIYVLDESGRVLFHPDPTLRGKDLRTDPAWRDISPAMPGTITGQWPDGSPSLISFASVGSTGWHVVVEEPLDDVIVPILRLSSALPALVLLVSVLSLIVIFFSFRTIVQPLQGLAEQTAQITGSVFDSLERDVGGVEEIRQLQRALRDMADRVRSYQESMRDYIDGITQGQETERARLSRELHDETVQNLVAIGLRLQLAERALDQGKARPAVEELRQARDLYTSALAKLRRTIHALRPVYLDELGFIPALQALTEEARASGPAVELLVSGEPRRLRPEVELAAYRVAQEALSNALRHANAYQVTVLVRFDDQVHLAIEDDGQGFVPSQVPDTLTRAGHYGLVGMRERVALLGGRLEVSSQPGRGTRISVHFPS